MTQEFRGTDRFELLRKLGEGGMGVVYEAMDHERGMRVALKTIRDLDPSRLYRFKREFRALTDVSHPHVVSLYELVSHEGRWFFTMEVVDGTDLTRWIRAAGSQQLMAAVADTGLEATPLATTMEVVRKTPAPRARQSIPSPLLAEERPLFAALCREDRLRTALGQLTEALRALHAAGLVHRDLKPANVRVTRSGRLVLMDFGVVADGRDGEPDTEAVMGTPAFMAPEQIAGGLVTPAADWYALGVLMYHAMTGRLPFSGTVHSVLIAKQELDPPPVSRMVKGAPEELVALCAELMARRPADRPSGDEVARRLGVGGDIPLRTTTTGGGHVFVGRQDELSRLRTALRKTADDQRFRCVTVVGDSGIGKTTLVRRFLHESEVTERTQSERGGGTLVLRGRCHPRESVPYKAFDPIVDRLADHLTGLPRARLSAVLPLDAHYLPRLFPVLRRVPGVDRAGIPASGDPDALRQAGFGALRELLTRLSSFGTVLVFIDDLQWADRDSIELLSALTARPHPPAVVLLATARSDVLPDNRMLVELLEGLTRAGLAQNIELGPLEDFERQELLREVLGSDQADALLVDEGWDEPGGNPLLLTQLARYAQERGGLLPGGRTSLQDVVHARIEQLPDPARQLLLRVAAAGTPAPLWALAQAAGLAPQVAERAMSVLRVTSLVRASRHGLEPWLTPYHGRVGDAVMSAMDDETRRVVHLTLAESMQRWDGASASLLAELWLGAGERSQAAKYLERAAREASEQLAFDRAAELFAGALEHGGGWNAGARQQLLESRAGALRAAGRFAEAADAYEAAAADAASLRRTQLLRHAANTRLKSGDVQRGLTTLREVLAAHGIRLPASRGEAGRMLLLHRLQLALRSYRFRDREESAIPARDLEALDALGGAAWTLVMFDPVFGGALQSRHLLLALKHGEPVRAWRALANEAGLMATRGGRHVGRAQRLVRRVELEASRRGDAYLSGAARMARGTVLFWTGRFEESTAAFAEAEQIADEQLVGAAFERNTARYFYCQACINRGAFGAAAEAVERFLEQARRRRDVYATNLFATQPSVWLHLLADDPERALADLEGALDGWPLDTFYMAHYLETIARVCVQLYTGDADAALEALRASRGAMRKHHVGFIPLLVLQFQMYLGRAANAVDERSDLAAAVGFLKGFHTPLAEALWTSLAATRAARDGAATDDIADLLLRSAAAAERGGLPHLVAGARYRLGHLLVGPGGERYAASAIAWAQAEGFAAPERYLRSLSPGFPEPADTSSSP